jgi:hypothetical protein
VVARNTSTSFSSLTRIEDFLPLRIDMSESNKHVDILGVGSVFPALDAVRQRHQGMSSDFRLLVERDTELERLRLSERF